MNHFKTWKEVMQKPSDFFRRMQKTGGYADSLTFAVINFSLYGLLTVLYNRGMYIHASIAVLAALLMPIVGIIFLLIGAVILHIIFKIFGGTGTYKDTIKLISYSTAVIVLSWIPFVGLILGIYGIYLCIVGGTFINNFSMGKSAISVLLLTSLDLLPLIILLFLQKMAH